MKKLLLLIVALVTFYTYSFAETIKVDRTMTYIGVIDEAEENVLKKGIKGSLYLELEKKQIRVYFLDYYLNESIIHADVIEDGKTEFYIFYLTNNVTVTLDINTLNYIVFFGDLYFSFLNR